MQVKHNNLNIIQNQPHVSANYGHYLAYYKNIKKNSYISHGFEISKSHMCIVI